MTQGGPLRTPAYDIAFAFTGRWHVVMPPYEGFPVHCVGRGDLTPPHETPCLSFRGTPQGYLLRGADWCAMTGGKQITRRHVVMPPYRGFPCTLRAAECRNH